jgi:hypothetical protein
LDKGEEEKVPAPRIDHMAANELYVKLNFDYQQQRRSNALLRVSRQNSLVKRSMSFSELG